MVVFRSYPRQFMGYCYRFKANAGNAGSLGLHRPQLWQGFIGRADDLHLIQGHWEVC
jgi:hypothetical protein